MSNTGSDARDAWVERSKRAGLTAFGAVSATGMWFGLCVAGAGFGALSPAGIRLGLYSLPVIAVCGALVGWFTSCHRLRWQVMGVWCAGALGGVVLVIPALALMGKVARFLDEAVGGVLRATGFDLVGFYMGVTGSEVVDLAQRENAQLELFLMSLVCAWVLLANLTANMAVGVWLGARVLGVGAVTDDEGEAT